MKIKEGRGEVGGGAKREWGKQEGRKRIVDKKTYNMNETRLPSKHQSWSIPNAWKIVHTQFMMFLIEFSKTNELYYKWIKLCLWMKFIVYDGPYGNLMIDKTLFMDQINYMYEL